MSLTAAVFYAVLGAVNIYVAYTMSEKTWVFFKAWILLPVVLVFTAALMFWLLYGYEEKKPT